jgi:hypothetical protein
MQVNLSNRTLSIILQALRTCKKEGYLPHIDDDGEDKDASYHEAEQIITELLEMETP